MCAEKNRLSVWLGIRLNERSLGFRIYLLPCGKSVMLFLLSYKFSNHGKQIS